jgi:hypothetical protein
VQSSKNESRRKVVAKAADNYAGDD